MENQININTKYKVRVLYDDFATTNDILVSYYLPLIRTSAFSLHSLLAVDSKNNAINTVYMPLERLISMSNLSLLQIKKSITKLEIVNLLNVIIGKNNKVIFELLKPLTPKEFNKSFQLSELLKSSAGNDNLEINNRLFNSLKNNNSSKQDTEDNKINEKNNLNINYDFDLIKSVILSKKIDWNNFWNDELEKVILDLIVIYRISAFDLALEIINLWEDNKLTTETLKENIVKEFKKEMDVVSIIDSGEKTKEVKLSYLKTLDVKDYFILRLNRMPSPSETEMIIELKQKYGLDKDMVNILIDYSILVNDGAINIKYISKISDTILKENINTQEKLIQHLRTSYKIKNKKGVIIHSKKDKLMKDIPIF